MSLADIGILTCRPGYFEDGCFRLTGWDPSSSSTIVKGVGDMSDNVARVRDVQVQKVPTSQHQDAEKREGWKLN